MADEGFFPSGRIQACSPPMVADPRGKQVTDGVGVCRASVSDSFDVDADRTPGVLAWVPEDELPPSLPQAAYEALFPHSRVDVIRWFPVFAAPSLSGQAR